jgi:phosphatidate cytidylyltransferase
VLIALLVGAIWLDGWLEARSGLPGLVLFPILAAAVIGASQEIAPIFRQLQTIASRRVFALCALAGLCASSFVPGDVVGVSGVAIVCSAAVVALVGAMLWYARHQSPHGVIQATSAALFAFVYPGLLAGFLFALVGAFNGWAVLWVLLVTKSYDIGAYFGGRWFGRHKLIPWLSPGKTWEGLLGGALVAAGVAALLAWLGRETGTFTLLPPGFAALVGGVLGLIGQAGDLVASMLKRDAGVKDFSTALPGFGGVMDVLDSPLLVAPVAYWLFILVTRMTG